MSIGDVERTMEDLIETIKVCLECCSGLTESLIAISGSIFLIRLSSDQQRRIQAYIAEIVVFQTRYNPELESHRQQGTGNREMFQQYAGQARALFSEGLGCLGQPLFTIQRLRNVGVEQSALIQTICDSAQKTSDNVRRIRVGHFDSQVRLQLTEWIKEFTSYINHYLYVHKSTYVKSSSSTDLALHEQYRRIGIIYFYRVWMDNLEKVQEERNSDFVLGLLCEREMFRRGFFMNGVQYVSVYTELVRRELRADSVIEDIESELKRLRLTARNLECALVRGVRASRANRGIRKLEGILRFSDLFAMVRSAVLEHVHKDSRVDEYSTRKEREILALGLGLAVVLIEVLLAGKRHLQLLMLFLVLAPAFVAKLYGLRLKWDEGVVRKYISPLGLKLSRYHRMCTLSMSLNDFSHTDEASIGYGLLVFFIVLANACASGFKHLAFNAFRVTSAILLTFIVLSKLRPYRYKLPSYQRLLKYGLSLFLIVPRLLQAKEYYDSELKLSVLLSDSFVPCLQLMMLLFASDFSEHSTSARVLTFCVGQFVFESSFDLLGYLSQKFVELLSAVDPCGLVQVNEAQRLLEVNITAPWKKIKTQFNKKSVAGHPDKHAGDPSGKWNVVMRDLLWARDKMQDCRSRYVDESVRASV